MEQVVRNHAMAPRPANASESAELLRLFETMLVIRRSEERLTMLFSEGAIPGFIHLSIGQEAVSAGIMLSLLRADTIASTHRGHGHALAKGMDLQLFFYELMGKREGLCQGRGGSMHVADNAVGMLGANGIVGAGIPIALGSALAQQVRGTGAISVAFFGDGAVAEGILHECLNLAALWKLPLLFACESNGWSEFSPSARQIAVSLEALAAAYGIPYQRIDGNDVVKVATASRDVIAAIRAGGGPQLIDCHTIRVRGHFEGDAQKYRPADEFDTFSAADPIPRASARLLELGLSQEEINAIEKRVLEKVDLAVTAARQGTEPNFTAALRDVYTSRESA